MISRDPDRSSRDPNMLKRNLENSWTCYLATVANYYIVCCDAVRSAILPTVWLLVLQWGKYFGQYWALGHVTSVSFTWYSGSKCCQTIKLRWQGMCTCYRLRMRSFLINFITSWEPGLNTPLTKAFFRRRDAYMWHSSNWVFSAITFNKCKKLTSLKIIVRTMWWYHSTKIAKIFWVTLDGATHGASISCPMHSYI